MKLGAYTAVLHDKPLPEALAILREMGLESAEINSGGFLRYYGEAHTARKVRYTLRRLSMRGRRCLSSIRLPMAVGALLQEALVEEATGVVSTMPLTGTRS